ncbi:MAG: type II secretion system GspH family protein [Epsilonproteobacteria bacterium]|nr:type II secretion system GspH family protein [Campylobacterota bacterium]
MNKKAFTLIEVLVSVVILATVAVLLFEISSNSKNNFLVLQKRIDYVTLSSLALIHNDQKYHNSDKSLYDFIREDYNISDYELRKYLKDRKVHYSHEEYTTFSPFSEGGSEQNQSILDFTIVFDKVFTTDKKHSSFAYKIYIKGN